MKDYKLGGMGQEEQTVGGCENMTSGNMRKGIRDVQSSKAGKHKLGVDTRVGKKAWRTREWV